MITSPHLVTRCSDSVMFLADVPMGETTSGAEQVLWQQVAERFPANRRASLNLAGHAFHMDNVLGDL